MIETVKDYNDMMLRYLEDIIDENGDRGYMTAEDSLEEIQEMSFSHYCPYLTHPYRGMILRQYTMSQHHTGMWTSSCPGFEQMDKDFIISTLPREMVPSEFRNCEINEGGCCECWTFNYLFTLAHIFENEKFWRVEWKK